jgi:hypothetical protein
MISKLEGMRNYLSSRGAIKRFEKYVTGEYTEPKNKEGAQ